MATNTSEQLFDVNISEQLQKMIGDLDMMDDDVNQISASALMEGAEMIAQEQRRLVSNRSTKLAGLIKVGKIVRTKKGNTQVLVGYDTNAINQAPEAVIMEFGRPGKRSKGVDKLGRKVGRFVAVNHIRKGFDNMSEKAIQHTIEKLDGVIKKW